MCGNRHPPERWQRGEGKGMGGLDPLWGGLEMVRVWARLETAERLLSVFCSL